MIVRLVKMTFKHEEAEAFKEIFASVSPKIKAFEGCSDVQLLQDVRNSNVFFTRSIWKSENHLDSYRNSELFKSTWKVTKARFAAKPEAWSTKIIEDK